MAALFLLPYGRPMKNIALALLLSATSAFAQTPCGGPFGAFIDGLKDEAVNAGLPAYVTEAFFRSVQLDDAVIRADRRQGVFQLDFLTFSRRLISADRLRNGTQKATQFDAIFDRIEAEYGVPRGVLLAFWAFETDFGAFQGDFNTANALVTLAHDCRRPELFRPQVIAAIELYARGDFDPTGTTGAWAGEIGQVQMLPADIIENGRDGDGDGRVSLKTSAADALTSGGAMLQSLGWRAGEPWLQEVDMPPTFDWTLTGLRTEKTVADWADLGVRARSGTLRTDLPGSILLPQGRKGPAFVAYPNYRVFFEWNQSFVYVTTAAYFATRLSGAPVYQAGDPDPGLDDAQMKRLQTRLQALGHDVGDIDGILGARTRAAVQAEQSRLGLPADAWPTRELLDRL